MNRDNEATDFAAWRFPQRYSRENSTSWAVEHYTPEHWPHLKQAARYVLTFGGAVLIGILIGKGL